MTPFYYLEVHQCRSTLYQKRFYCKGIKFRRQTSNSRSIATVILWCISKAILPWCKLNADPWSFSCLVHFINSISSVPSFSFGSKLSCKSKTKQPSNKSNTRILNHINSLSPILCCLGFPRLLTLLNFKTEKYVRLFHCFFTTSFLYQNVLSQKYLFEI